MSQSRVAKAPASPGTGAARSGGGAPSAPVSHNTGHRHLRGGFVGHLDYYIELTGHHTGRADDHADIVGPRRAAKVDVRTADVPDPGDDQHGERRQRRQSVRQRRAAHRFTRRSQSPQARPSRDDSTARPAASANPPASLAGRTGGKMCR